MPIIHHEHEQGSLKWLEARRGVITASMFKHCRDYKAPTAAQKKDGVTRGEPSAKLLGYAFDLARERLGGKAPEKFQSAAMREGREQEQFARAAYEAQTGNIVEQVGFFTTEDGEFGCSPDGLIGDDGIIEIKTMVSSETLFTAVAEGDISEYLDQCLGTLWILGRKWVDLCLWIPDMDKLIVKRIERDENAIEVLEADLLTFAAIVEQKQLALKSALS